MNFKSYIDAIKYKKMGNESCFIIGGWCFSVSGEKVEYQVLVNLIYKRLREEMSHKKWRNISRNCRVDSL